MQIQEAELAEAEAERRDGFEALVGRQARFVFQVAYAVLRNAADAEDVAQEVFLKVHRSRAWERMQDERAFLARSAWRLAVGLAPKRRSQALDPSFETRQPNPEEAAIASDRDRVVHRLMDALPEELRQVLALSAMEGLDSREIAAVIGVSEGTVRTRQMRGRELLKSKLAALSAGKRGPGDA